MKILYLHHHHHHHGLQDSKTQQQFILRKVYLCNPSNLQNIPSLASHHSFHMQTIWRTSSCSNHSMRLQSMPSWGCPEMSENLVWGGDRKQAQLLKEQKKGPEEISCDQSMKLMITSPKTPKRKRKNETTHHEVEKWKEGRDWNCWERHVPPKQKTHKTSKQGEMGEAFLHGCQRPVDFILLPQVSNI
jgi:hypothetical protein